MLNESRKVECYLYMEYLQLCKINIVSFNFCKIKNSICNSCIHMFKNNINIISRRLQFLLKMKDIETRKHLLKRVLNESRKAQCALYIEYLQQCKINIASFNFPYNKIVVFPTPVYICLKIILTISLDVCSFV